MVAHHEVRVLGNDNLRIGTAVSVLLRDVTLYLPLVIDPDCAAVDLQPPGTAMTRLM